MAVKRVHLRESWVYGRAELPASTADTVESLNLQGTYREKILTLGDAFKNFKSLRSLDLSRNLIISLQGIEYLHALHSLNLYYNNIESVEEIKRLRTLSHLKILDLRLNPVTRQDTDYRLIVIHALGTIETLDERPVRDSERKNAEFNFHFKEYKPKERPEVEIGSIGKSNSYTQKTSARAHLDFNMSNTDFNKITRESERTDYMKGLSPSKYETVEHQSYVQPPSDYEDDYRPLPSPTRSSLRSPGPSSRVKEGHRVTFAESTISELFPKNEDFARRLESDTEKLTSDKPASAFSFKNTYLTSTPVKKESTSSDRVRADTRALDDRGWRAESRDHLKPTEESNRERLLRLSSDLYVTTHLSDPPTTSNSLSALRKGFTDVSKTYTLPSKPTLANSHLSTGKTLNRPECNSNYKYSWSPEKMSSIKFDSLSVPQNGMKRASSLNSLLSPKGITSDDLLLGNELKKRDHSPSREVPSISDVLHQLMELVDRYWNGSGSLLQNQRFLVPAQDLLSRLMSAKQTSQVDSTRSHRQNEDTETTTSLLVVSFTHEGTKIQHFSSSLELKHLTFVSRWDTFVGNGVTWECGYSKLLYSGRSIEPEDTVQLCNLSTGLGQDSMKLKLIKVMEENHFLRTKVYKLENQASNKEGSGGSPVHQDDLQQKYEQLSLQVESLQQQLGKNTKLQETINLLHNSQRSLVCTNEYLLQQLSKVSPTAASRPPRGTSPDRTSKDRYLYAEPSEPSTLTSHSTGHYRTPQSLSLCPL